MSHPTKKVLSPYRYAETGKRCYIDIDVKIVPFIKELWKAGINTSESCQEATWADQSKMVFIVMDDIADLRKFTQIVLTTDSDDPLTRHIILMADEPDEVRWEIKVEPYKEDNGELYIAVFLLFPQADLPLLTKRLQAYNERRQPKPTLPQPKGQIKVTTWNAVEGYSGKPHRRITGAKIDRRICKQVFMAGGKRWGQGREGDILCLNLAAPDAKSAYAYDFYFDNYCPSKLGKTTSLSGGSYPAWSINIKGMLNKTEQQIDALIHKVVAAHAKELARLQKAYKASKKGLQ